MLLIFSSHLPAGPGKLKNLEVLKEDFHGRAKGNGDGIVAIDSFYVIVTGKSSAFQGVVDKLWAGLKENGNERIEV